MVPGRSQTLAQNTMPEHGVTLGGRLLSRIEGSSYVKKELEAESLKGPLVFLLRHIVKYVSILVT